MFYEHDDGIRPTTRRARVLKVDDSKSQQRINLSGLKSEELKKIWRPQDFGISSNPPKDSDGVILQMGSRSDRSLYFDGGHEKHRPKNTPEGGTTIYNHEGDIIRMFPSRADIVHKSKVNIRIGKGYKTGSGEASGEDDESGSDTKTISIAMDGDKIVIAYQGAKVSWNETSLLAEFGSSSVKLENGKATMSATHVIINSNQVDLGGEGGTLVGLCGGGCATKVRAV